MEDFIDLVKKYEDIYFEMTSKVHTDKELYEYSCKLAELIVEIEFAKLNIIYDELDFENV